MLKVLDNVHKRKEAGERNQRRQVTNQVTKHPPTDKKHWERSANVQDYLGT